MKIEERLTASGFIIDAALAYYDDKVLRIELKEIIGFVQLKD